MQKAEISIRIALASDAVELRAVCEKSFYDTFVNTCKESDMDTYLRKKFSLRLIEQELAEGFFYLLIYQSKILGYAKLGENTIPELSGKKAIEIERFYFLKEYTGKGLGNELMKVCLEYAEKKSAELVFLGVWEHNYNAQKFYKKYGFEYVGKHPFPIETTPQMDWWLSKSLK